MFKRTIEKELIRWKESPIRKPLILRGARQVGKTSIVRKFAEENFDNFVEINLEKPDYKKIFKNVDTVSEFILKAETVSKKHINEGVTLLFIDEIQESIDVLNLLRFFAEDKPNLHVIAAGSLLEAKLLDGWKIPVGRVDYKYLYPMTFFEYLESIEEIELLKKPESTTYLLEKHFKDYLLIGGMPEAVYSFTTQKNLGFVKTVHERLISSYNDDIDKYAKDFEKKYLQLIMNYGPLIAGSIYKYENFGDSEYRGREIREAIDSLQRIMLLKEIPSINSTNMPFIPKLKRGKKMIWLDIGIVNHVNNTQLDIMSGNYKGRMMEQYVGQTLLSSGLNNKFYLYYWAKNKDEGSAEVDFCFQHKDKIVAIEVKSGATKEMKSLFSMIDTGGETILPIRISWDKLGIENYQHNNKKYKILSIPFYLLENWQELINLL